MVGTFAFGLFGCGVCCCAVRDSEFGNVVAVAGTLVGLFVFEQFREAKIQSSAWPLSDTIMLPALISRWMMFLE